MLEYMLYSTYAFVRHIAKTMGIAYLHLFDKQHSREPQVPITNGCEASVRSCTLATKAGTCLSHPVFWGGELCRSLSGSARAASRKRSLFAIGTCGSLRCVLSAGASYLRVRPICGCVLSTGASYLRVHSNHDNV